MILDNCDHLFRAFRRFPTTNVQSLYKAIRIRPRQLKNDTEVSGHPYASKARYVLACAYSATSLCRFCYAPFAHWAVLGWQLFRADHRTNMLQRGNRGWGRFLSSTMIMVSHTWWCKKWTITPVKIAALPWNPSAGNYRGTAVLGKNIRYVCAPPPAGGGGVEVY